MAKKEIRSLDYLIDEIIKESKFYKNLKADKNNFSYWFPKIESCANDNLFIPESIIIQVPEDVYYRFYMDSPKYDKAYIAGWIQDNVMPQIPDKHWNFLFIKNGTFSNKFDFCDCTPNNDFYEIVNSVVNINYAGLCLGTGGYTELVIRKNIFKAYNNPAHFYRIYNGMPLVPEYRVFYDFDKHKVLYSVNYWDKDYCSKAISRDKTDEIVYKAVYEATLLMPFMKYKDEVETLILDAFKDIDTLDGIWSTDVMWIPNKGYYLIDMAMAETSAYWDVNKVN